MKSFLCKMAVGADLMISKKIIKYMKGHNKDIFAYSL